MRTVTCLAKGHSRCPKFIPVPFSRKDEVAQSVGQWLVDGVKYADAFSHLGTLRVGYTK